MDIKKCDICKKVIKENENKYYLTIRKPWKSMDICERCGKPLEKIIQQNK